MLLQKLAKILSITSVALNLISCGDQYPTITPYMNAPNAQGQCPKYKLVDPAKLTFQFDSWAPCSDTIGGWSVPKGQLEASLAWGRREINNCKQAIIEQEESRR